MSFEVIVRDGCLHLAGEMTIYFAGELKSGLLDALRSADGEAALDLSAVSEFDTAGLQLLLLARRESLARGNAFSLRAASTVVEEALELCGLRQSFAAQASEVRS